MNYIVLDLEWNQGNPQREPEVYGVPFEIVEIGAIKLNEEKKMTELERAASDRTFREMLYKRYGI